MKREFLQSLGELSKETVDAIMAENGRDIEKTRASFADYETLREQKEVYLQQKEELETLRKDCEEWKTKYDRSRQENAEKLRKMEFDHILRSEIAARKGRSQKAISALLDLDSLQSSENPQEAVRQAIAQLKEENGYLFEPDQQPPAYAKGTGTGRNNDDRMPATLAGALRQKFERK